MTSAFSWQKSVSLWPALFCTQRPNLPVTPGISWLIFTFQSPIMKRTSFFFWVFNWHLSLSHVADFTFYRERKKWNWEDLEHEICLRCFFVYVAFAFSIKSKKSSVRPMSVGYHLGFLVGILYFQVLFFNLFWVNFCVLYKWSSFIPLHGCPVAPKACIK